jgi:hypothetical protein
VDDIATNDSHSATSHELGCTSVRDDDYARAAIAAITTTAAATTT